MDIGIGLPNTVPDTEGRTLVDWARAAEDAGFSTLGTIGRLVYPNYEELIALSAAAAVTSRIRLTTSVLLAPRPRKLTLAYFALGPDARAQADRYLQDYYGWLGDIANMIAAGAAISAEMVKSYVAAFEASGCDEVIFVPTASRLDQVSLLADAVA